MPASNGYSELAALMFTTERPKIKIIFLSNCIASLLLWLTFQLLGHANLGSSSECFALAQVFVVLLVAPYLAASRTDTDNRTPKSAQMLLPNPIPSANPLLKRLTVSQIPLLCWVLLSTTFSFFTTEISIGKVLAMLIVLTLYSFSAGAVGMWGARVFKDVIFGTEFTCFIWVVLIGSAFMLKPLARYIENPQPMFQPILHLNPLIAVCNIFDGMDIFRNPLFYALTPLTDYVYAYPPWYVSCFWQLVLGSVCFLWTWGLYRSPTCAATN